MKVQTSGTRGVVKVSGVHPGDFVDIPSMRISGMVTDRRAGVHPAIVVLTIQATPEAPERTYHLSAERIAILD